MTRESTGTPSAPFKNREPPAKPRFLETERVGERGADLGVCGARRRRRRWGGWEGGAGERARRVYVEGLEEEEHAAARHCLEWGRGRSHLGGGSAPSGLIFGK